MASENKSRQSALKRKASEVSLNDTQSEFGGKIKSVKKTPESNEKEISK
jgi:hypothetical protein